MEDPSWLEGALSALAAIHARNLAPDAGAPADAPIAVMDSGVGGLPYLETIRALMPGGTFVYLADRAGFPYGTKSHAEIEAIVVDRVRALVAAFHPRALVIACNTASQAALAAARDAFPGLPIVGTVPAVKPAAERSRSGTIAVIATRHAVGDPYLDSLVASHAAGRTVLREPAQDLVTFVERDFVSSDAASRRAAIESHVRPLLERGADEIVLACTHFLHVAPDIEAYARDWARERGLEGRIEVVDSRDGVARRLRDVLAAGPDGKGSARGGAAAVGPDGQAGEGQREDGVFLLSGPPPFEPGYSAFASRYGLAGPFSLEPAPGGAR